MTSALGCCGHANTSSLRFNSSDVSGSDLITLGSFLNAENRPDSPSVHSLNLSNEHPNSALLGSYLVGSGVTRSDVHKDVDVEVTKSELSVPVK